MSESLFVARPVAEASVDDRASFLTRTYLHLFGAVLAFIGLEGLFFTTPLPQIVFEFIAGGRYHWLLMLGAFIGVGWVAERWANGLESRAMQYVGLGVYVLAETILFMPLLYLASVYASPSTIPAAGLTTLLLFSGLTAIVFVTRRDFSFLKGILGVLGMSALALIAGSIVFQLSLGLIFSVAMVALASGYILYYTSKVMHHYRTDQHVAASLALFAAIAMLFWYVLRIFMRARD